MYSIINKNNNEKPYNINSNTKSINLQPNYWVSKESSKPLSHETKFINISTGSVRNIQDKIMRSTEQSYTGNNQRIIINKQQNNFEPKPIYNENFQWENLTNSLKRPLLINDLDFTDLRDDDDADICAINDNNLAHPPPPPPPLPIPNCVTPPPPPPPLISNCATPPPPPPPPMLGAPQTPSQMLNNTQSVSTTPPPPPPRMGGPFLWNNRYQTPSPTPSETSKIIPKNKKTLKLFWKEVKEDKSLLSRIMKKKTIWDEIKAVPIDTQKLEHLFENKAKEINNKVS